MLCVIDTAFPFQSYRHNTWYLQRQYVAMRIASQAVQILAMVIIDCIGTCRCKANYIAGQVGRLIQSAKKQEVICGEVTYYL